MSTSSIKPGQSPSGPIRWATSSWTCSEASGERNSCAASPTNVRWRAVARSMRSSIALRVTASRWISSWAIGTGSRCPASPAAVMSAAPWRSAATDRRVSATTKYVDSPSSSTAIGPPISAARVSTRTLSSTRDRSVSTTTVRLLAGLASARKRSPVNGSMMSSRSPARACGQFGRAQRRVTRSAPGDASTTWSDASTTCTAVTPPVVGYTVWFGTSGCLRICSAMSLAVFCAVASSTRTRA